MPEHQALHRTLVRWATIPLVLIAIAGLGAAILSLPAEDPGLAPLVESHMPDLDMGNRVTAVLMDFRGYDTLLELGVLLLAVVLIWSLAAAPTPLEPYAGPLLQSFVRTVGPIMLVVAGYLFWAGTDQPGGEFQAGAVLGALGVMLLLADWRLPDSVRGWPLRLMLIAGLSVFLSIAVAMVFLEGRFLEYPPAHAKVLILVIEVAATVSISAILVSLYVGGHPGSEDSKLDEDPS